MRIPYGHLFTVGALILIILAGYGQAPPEEAKATQRPARAKRRPTHQRTVAERTQRPTFVEHGDLNSTKVALTFDACEDNHPAGYDQNIIEILISAKAPATLFLGGKWIDSHPTEARDLAGNDLFELGNHSFGHPDFTKIETEQARQEISDTQDRLQTLTGKEAKFFRFPFGRYDQGTLDLVSSLGLSAIQWNVVTGDPDRNVSAQTIVNTVAKRAAGGSIVIMHMNGRGWNTAEALPAVINDLRSRGLELVTVSDLLI